MTGPVKPWQRHASPLARQAWCVYALLIVYGSLYPFSGWLALGVGPFAYLTAPFPQYLTWFDVVTNVMGYMPLGALGVLALYPVTRGATAVLIAALLGSGLSAGMEALQTYLPERVASNLDLASNALGCLLGATLMAPYVSTVLDRGLLRGLRYVWFERQASFLLALVMLWPFAQMYPQPFLFGAGEWPRQVWEAVDPTIKAELLWWSPSLAGLPDWLGGKLDSVTWEALVTALGVLGATLLASLAMRPMAPRRLLCLALVAAAVVAKAGASRLQGGDQSFDWLTIGAAQGLVAGALLSIWMVRWRYRVRAWVAFGCLLLGLLLANLLPLNPYFDDLVRGWRQGQYRHLNVLAQWLAWAWPYVALVWMLFSAERAWLVQRAAREHRERLMGTGLGNAGQTPANAPNDGPERPSL